MSIDALIESLSAKTFDEIIQDIEDNDTPSGFFDD